eukprot:3967964-Amphidinium_carterae.3
MTFSSTNNGAASSSREYVKTDRSAPVTCPPRRVLIRTSTPALAHHDGSVVLNEWEPNCSRIAALICTISGPITSSKTQTNAHALDVIDVFVHRCRSSSANNRVP